MKGPLLVRRALTNALIMQDRRGNSAGLIVTLSERITARRRGPPSCDTPELETFTTHELQSEEGGDPVSALCQRALVSAG